MRGAAITVRRVDATLPEIAQRLVSLQRSVLPQDEPRAIAGDLWWMAFDGPRVIGFASMRMIPTDHGAVAYLSRSGVVRRARGQGVQKRLIEARLRYARQHGAVVSISDTADNPPSANSLIAKGFRVHDPEYRWALPHSIYWIKSLERAQERKKQG